MGTFSVLWNILKELGLTGGNLILLVLLIVGYFKLAKNHFKHITDKLECLDSKYANLKKLWNNVDKRLGIVATRLNDHINKK